MALRLTSFSDLPSAAPRIVPVNISRFNVAGYDRDNGYPQRMKSLVKASPTAKMVCNLYADFIFGQGFSVSEGKTKSGKDKEDGIWNRVFNSKGHTGDDLLSLAAADYAEWEKFYLHINYNALFQGVELSVIPFENVRYGINERAGMVAVYDKWWVNDRFGRLNTANDKPDYIDLYNPDPAAIKKQVAKANGWKNYKGQVLAFSKSFENYPEHILDAGIEAMEAEIMSLRTTRSNLKNNFGDKIVWLQKAVFESDDQRNEFVKGFKNYLGPDGSQVIVLEPNNSGDELPEFKTIENKLDDKKFAYSDNKTRSTLYRLAGQNAILHSDLTEGRYNQNQLPEAIKVYNNRTERPRINLQRAFKNVMDIMGIDSDCAITPLNELSAAQNTQGANNNDGNTLDNQI